MAKKMATVTREGDRLEELKNLALVLAKRIDGDDGSHSLAQLARQYRETIAEIDALKGDRDGGDGLDALLG